MVVLKAELKSEKSNLAQEPGCGAQGCDEGSGRPRPQPTYWTHKQIGVGHGGHWCMPLGS